MKVKLIIILTFFLCFLFFSLCPRFRQHPVQYYIEVAKRLKHKADAMVSLGPCARNINQLLHSDPIHTCTWITFTDCHYFHTPYLECVQVICGKAVFICQMFRHFPLLQMHLGNISPEQDSELTLPEVSRPSCFAELWQSPWKIDRTLSFKTVYSGTSGCW